MLKIFFILAFSFSFQSQTGNGPPASCIGDLYCSGFGFTLCSVAIPPGGYCIVDNHDTSITCTAFDSDGNTVEVDTSTCPGIVNGGNCDPGQPWWICTPEYV